VRVAFTVLAVLMSLFAATPVRAADDIVVRSAHVKVRDGVLEFNVRVDFPLDERMRAALNAGATVDLDVEARVYLQNRYWLDEELVAGNLKRELSWSALTKRFVLRDLDSSHQRTFATLEEAMAAAGKVESWPLELDAKLDPEATYEINVRGRLRRGRLPSALRALTSWTRYWNRSEWYTWTLPR